MWLPPYNCNLNTYGKSLINHKSGFVYSLMLNLYEKKSLNDLLYRLKFSPKELSFYLTILEGAGFIKGDEFEIEENDDSFILNKKFIVTEEGKSELNKIYEKQKLKEIFN